MKIVLLLLITTFIASGQRITTIQLDGVQYFVSRMNPYSPELNYFLAYQYCRSLGLQLASFETKEKADTMTQYLKNAGYTKYDFWTSGNKLGTDMFLWMSSGLPFNATFDYMLRRTGNRAVDVPPGTEPQRVARESGDSGSSDGCVAMVAPSLAWDAQDCTRVKDFICEQTRCYYYNYGSIPVSATQGNRRPYSSTTTTALPDTDSNDDNADKLETETTDVDKNVEDEPEDNTNQEHQTEIYDSNITNNSNNDNNDNDSHKEEIEESSNSPDTLTLPEDPVVGRLISTASSDPLTKTQSREDVIKERSRTEDIPDITSLFTGNPAIKSRTDTVFAGLETHEIRSLQRASQQSPTYDKTASQPDNALESKTIGPYDSDQDYANDAPDNTNSGSGDVLKDQEEDLSTILPDAEPAYRYNIKVRSNGKVLDPPSK
ncbi:hypothetical protein G9C98_003372 [Cotesia typhae]|uniref:C-type lectin domain-containing protein n=1 Tax=Cotesia typhae TaxID=2053667 RepID=A0A8J5QQ75_9HYME|nr:hypothetical protein G9C98_003372 [Cotesia typhae]